MKRMTTWLVSGVHIGPGTRLWSVTKYVTDGVQKSCQSRPESVRLFIEQDKRLGSSGHPDRNNGGTGATWVLLK